MLIKCELEKKEILLVECLIGTEKKAKIHLSKYITGNRKKFWRIWHLVILREFLECCCSVAGASCCCLGMDSSCGCCSEMDSSCGCCSEAGLSCGCCSETDLSCEVDGFGSAVFTSEVRFLLDAFLPGLYFLPLTARWSFFSATAKSHSH